MQPADHDVTLQLPRGDGRRPRPPWPVLALAVVAAIAVGVAAVTLWGGDSENVRSERLPATSTTVPATSTTAPATSETVADAPSTTAGGRGTATTRPTATTPPTTAPQRLATSRVSLDGMGPVDIGMTLEQASAAAGTPFRLLGARDPGGDCVYARADAAPEGVLFMVISGRIERVDVGGAGPSSVTTVSGIGIGATEAEVQSTYPGRIRVEGHPYVPSGHYLIYTPNDPSLAHLSMIFETDGQRVTSFRAGLRGAVAQIEGCS